MISPENRKLLSEMSHTAYAKALEAYVNNAVEELRNIQTVKSYEELLGRQWAETYLKKALSFTEEKDATGKQKNPYV